MKTSDSKKSNAITLIDHVWANVAEDIGHSWQRINRAMSDALELCISGGLHFDLGDFTAVMGMRGVEHWIGADRGEWAYTMAVRYGHRSFCQAYEQHTGRKPFILCGRRLCAGTVMREVRELVPSEASGPLPEWLVFPSAEVTSFPSTESFLVCSDWDKEKKQRIGRPVRRWTVDRDGFKAAVAACKAKAAKVSS